MLLAHPNIDVNLKDKDGQTPLSLSCEYGLVAIVRWLVKDSRVTLFDSNGHTPLWHASRDGYCEVIEWLIASDRDLGDIKNKKGKDWRDGSP